MPPTLRAAGLRPVQVWVPDTRDPEFIAKCRRQSRLPAETAAESEAEDLDFIESATDLDDWE
ncbi:antitoxin MazE family protein [Paraburkholderia phymatum]|uniref:antitoxin MazE family protein n=1 Tax=Paraburkholderia phymatum TaxID=148447 RepID=UPI0031744BBB